MSKKLDDASENVRKQFAKAQEVKQQQRQELPTPTPKPGGMDLKPGGQLQREVDTPILKNQLADKAKELKELNEAAKARHEAQKQLDLKNEQEKDNDDRSG
jgi:hypothetical protein